MHLTVHRLHDQQLVIQPPTTNDYTRAEGGLRITEVAPGGKLNALLDKAGNDGRRSDALSGHSFGPGNNGETPTATPKALAAGSCPHAPFSGSITASQGESLLPSDPAMAAWRPRPSSRTERDRLGDRDSLSSMKSQGEAAATAAADAAVAAALDGPGSIGGIKKSFSGSGGGGGGPLKTSERQQAFMIRRFNSLTLRQKAAHR